MAWNFTQYNFLKMIDFVHTQRLSNHCCRGSQEKNVSRSYWLQDQCLYSVLQGKGDKEVIFIFLVIIPSSTWLVEHHLECFWSTIGTLTEMHLFYFYSLGFGLWNFCIYVVDKKIGYYGTLTSYIPIFIGFFLLFLNLQTILMFPVTTGVRQEIVCNDSFCWAAKI